MLRVLGTPEFGNHYAPAGSDAWLVFGMRGGAYNEDSLISFIEELHAELGEDKCTLIWDGLVSHRSKNMKAFLKAQRYWLVVEQLPGYVHDLNSIEVVWGNLKSSEPANLCPDNLGEAARAAEDGLDRIGGDADLCLTFLRHAL